MVSHITCMLTRFVYLAPYLCRGTPTCSPSLFRRVTPFSTPCVCITHTPRCTTEYLLYPVKGMGTYLGSWYQFKIILWFFKKHMLRHKICLFVILKTCYFKNSVKFLRAYQHRLEWPGLLCVSSVAYPFFPSAQTFYIYKYVPPPFRCTFFYVKPSS